MDENGVICDKSVMSLLVKRFDSEISNGETVVNIAAVKKFDMLSFKSLETMHKYFKYASRNKAM